MTIEQRMEHLEFEIERLNLRNHRWRRLACTMAVLIGAAVGIGAAQMNEDELTLKKLVIQDGEGRNRIVLDTNFLFAGITHYDANGKIRINSSTLASGYASTSLYDPNGKPRIRSGTLADGSTKTIYLDANGEERIGSGTTADGSTAIALSDANGEVRIRSGTYPSGNASMTHYDAKEKMRIRSGTFTDGLAGTTWLEYDANGKRQPVKILP